MLIIFIRKQIKIIDIDNILIYNRSKGGEHMIHSNLSTLMGSKRMNIQDVCNATGLSRNTVAFLYKDKVKRIDYDTLEKLCELFECEVGDILKNERL